MDNDILTVNQTAQYLQVCDKTVRRMIASEKIPAYKLGKSWRIKKVDIEQLFNGKQKTNEGE
ncbi:helix-turn-helix domain-containing protein [Chakrabartyella piscis]|uniref:helix-turn-helix domain-containing protein n=1 Tax=Chakrabartyella piscis TaxID=2918914 RepID=UPI00295860F4|nr:helix-turn-helix domain-containing protein [Chakrabartyella piscis]